MFVEMKIRICAVKELQEFTTCPVTFKSVNTRFKCMCICFVIITEHFKQIAALELWLIPIR